MVLVSDPRDVREAADSAEDSGGVVEKVVYDWSVCGSHGHFGPKHVRFTAKLPENWV